jgi:hypothetical protein
MHPAIVSAKAMGAGMPLTISTAFGAAAAAASIHILLTANNTEVRAQVKSSRLPAAMVTKQLARGAAPGQHKTVAMLEFDQQSETMGHAQPS